LGLGVGPHELGVLDEPEGSLGIIAGSLYVQFDSSRPL